MRLWTFLLASLSGQGWEGRSRRADYGLAPWVWQKGEILGDRRSTWMCLTPEVQWRQAASCCQEGVEEERRACPESDQQVLTAVTDRVREVNKNSSEEMSIIVIVTVTKAKAQVKTSVARWRDQHVRWAICVDTQDNERRGRWKGELGVLKSLAVC